MLAQPIVEVAAVVPVAKVFLVLQTLTHLMEVLGNHYQHSQQLIWDQ